MSLEGSSTFEGHIAHTNTIHTACASILNQAVSKGSLGKIHQKVELNCPKSPPMTTYEQFSQTFCLV